MTISDAAGRAKKLQLEGKLIERLIVANETFRLGREHMAYLEDRRNKIKVAANAIALQLRAVSDFRLKK